MIKESNTDFVEREIYREVIQWLDEREIIALSGPRQAGKTTLLLRLKGRLQKEKRVLINFEETEQVAAFEKSAEEFISLHLADKGRTFFLFDEFQYVKNGGKILKLLFDKYPQAKFIITGSSSLKMRQMASFLVGRVIFFNLYPFSFGEFLSFKDKVLFNLWRKFNEVFFNFFSEDKVHLPSLLYEEKLEKYFENYLIFGGYPAIVKSREEKKQARLSSLMETYIEKDIVKFLQIGKFLEFRNLAGVLSGQISGLLNYSSLSQDTGLSYREVKKFLAGLEKTFVIKQISPFYSNRISEIRKSPKVFFIDMGLRNSLINDFRALDLRQDKGALAENFVFANLFYRPRTRDLYFWRTKQGAEMDFVLRWQNEIIPCEVKYQEMKRPVLSRSFLSFLENYKPEKAVMMTKNYAGIERFKRTKVLFLPVYFV